MTQLKRCLVACGVVLVLAAASPAQAIVLTYEVGPMDNLYFTNWGHIYNGPPDNALGTGVAAESVSSGGSPFNFSGFDTLYVSATGCIEDAGTLCTGPDGLPGIFRGLTVYAMIGIWSSSGLAITPLSMSFVVGSNAALPVPTGSSAYLFLAENDGGFGDNTYGAYAVTIDTVPEPSTVSLMALGVGALVAAGARRRRHA